jgi:hypothetical protein
VRGLAPGQAVRGDEDQSFPHPPAGSCRCNVVFLAARRAWPRRAFWEAGTHTREAATPALRLGVSAMRTAPINGDAT